MTVIDVRHLFPLPSVWWRGQRSGPQDVNYIACHYLGDDGTFFGPGTTQDAEINFLKVIHQYHLSIGYGGFGYHGAGFASGRSYYCTDLNRWGANVLGRNDEVVGVLGAFSGDVVPHLGIQRGMADFIAFADKTYLGTPLRPLKGHRELVSTRCPGDPYQQWVPQLREKEDDMALDDKDRQWLGALGRNIVKAITEGPFPSLLQGDPNYTDAKHDLKDILAAIAKIQAAGGLSEAQIRALMREEIDKTKLGA